MAGPPTLRLTSSELAAVLLLLVAGLFLKAWITTALEPGLGDRGYATNVARLIVLPFVLLCAWFVVRERRRILSRLFAPRRFGLRMLVSALLLGALLRVLWWTQATARVAFGAGVDSLAQADSYFSLGYACPPAAVVAVAALAWLLLVPVTEEFVHRGILLSAFADRGGAFAVGVSAAIFAAAHPVGSIPFVVLSGIILGVQYWRCGSLLPPIVTHATYDGLQILDWLCLRIAWRPAADALPLWRIGFAALVVGALASAAIVMLLWNAGQRRDTPPPRA